MPRLRGSHTYNRSLDHSSIATLSLSTPTWCKQGSPQLGLPQATEENRRDTATFTTKDSSALATTAISNTKVHTVSATKEPCNRH